MLFMALINLGGVILSFVEVLALPGFMFFSNAWIFFILLSRMRKQAKQHAPHNVPPSATP
ncbi:hypothetical protein NOSIN_23365 [Nocardiopsis sinuspersici]|uniref:Uncharacterized protein n=1 Tax=Nocardiopsis sinuspersici TaxID=501010 RepID=A0A1V3C6N0_9ACTN|nr:hypothetical protein NOSIN_23365 [Nocardiopsis sinuspersici]